MLYLHWKFFVVDEAVEDLLQSQVEVDLVGELDLAEVAHHPACLAETVGIGWRANHTVLYSGAQAVGLVYYIKLCNKQVVSKSVQQRCSY